MKLRKVLKTSAAISLGLSALVLLGGYGWLYGWKWGGTPAAHATLTVEDVQRLQGLDTYLTTQAVQANYQLVRENWLFNMEEDEAEIHWLVELSLRLSADWGSKCSFASARESLHDFLATGNAAGNTEALAVLALMKQDVPLFKLIAERVSPSELQRLLTPVLYCAAPGTECMQAAQRLELLGWMHARGVSVAGSIPAHWFVEKVRFSMLYSDDTGGEILDWFLRHGYQLGASELAGLFLLSPQASLPTWQKLIEDGILPQPPRELVFQGENCTLLQIVAGADTPAPDAVRWLLSLGHQPNALPAGENRCTPVDACLKSIRYASLGQSEEEDARLRGKVEMLDILLQHGAMPTPETRELLPLDRALDKEITELFRKHSFHLDAGENPYNACCMPE